MTVPLMNRPNQAVLVLSTVLGSWLGMQDIHELGHVLGAWTSGGHVKQVVLNPLSFSRTDLAENPHPLFVAWAGPAFGVLGPLLLWGLLVVFRVPGAFLARYFVGFCCIANGAYIAAGSFDEVGDCGEMLRHGSAPWQLWLFGTVTIPLGLWLWHRQAKYFGIGRDANTVDSRLAMTTLGICLFLLAVGFVIDGR